MEHKGNGEEAAKKHTPKPWPALITMEEKLALFPEYNTSNLWSRYPSTHMMPALWFCETKPVIGRTGKQRMVGTCLASAKDFDGVNACPRCQHMGKSEFKDGGMVHFRNLIQEAYKRECKNIRNFRAGSVRCVTSIGRLNFECQVKACQWKLVYTMRKPPEGVSPTILCELDEKLSVPEHHPDCYLTSEENDEDEKGPQTAKALITSRAKWGLWTDEIANLIIHCSKSTRREGHKATAQLVTTRLEGMSIPVAVNAYQVGQVLLEFERSAKMFSAMDTVERLIEEKTKDPNYFAQWNTTAGELTGLFFATPIQREAASASAQFVMLNSKSGTTRHGWQLVILGGMNAHLQTITFGQAYVPNMSMENCVWIFRAFRESLTDPSVVKVVMVDGSKTECAAVKEVFDVPALLCVQNLAMKEIPHGLQDAFSHSCRFEAFMQLFWRAYHTESRQGCVMFLDKMWEMVSEEVPFDVDEPVVFKSPQGVVKAKVVSSEVGVTRVDAGKAGVITFDERKYGSDQLYTKRHSSRRECFLAYVEHLREVRSQWAKCFTRELLSMGSTTCERLADMLKSTRQCWLNEVLLSVAVSKVNATEVAQARQLVLRARRLKVGDSVTDPSLRSLWFFLRELVYPLWILNLVEKWCSLIQVYTCELKQTTPVDDSSSSTTFSVAVHYAHFPPPTLPVHELDEQHLPAQARAERSASNVLTFKGFDTLTLSDDLVLQPSAIPPALAKLGLRPGMTIVSTDPADGDVTSPDTTLVASFLPRQWEVSVTVAAAPPPTTEQNARTDPLRGSSRCTHAWCGCGYMTSFQIPCVHTVAALRHLSALNPSPPAAASPLSTTTSTPAIPEQPREPTPSPHIPLTPDSSTTSPPLTLEFPKLVVSLIQDRWQLPRRQRNRSKTSQQSHLQKIDEICKELTSSAERLPEESRKGLLAELERIQSQFQPLMEQQPHSVESSRPSKKRPAEDQEASSKKGRGRPQPEVAAAPPQPAPPAPAQVHSA